jgi:hypothetical protein
LATTGSRARPAFVAEDDHYRLVLPKIGVVLNFDRLRRDHSDMVGTLCVECVQRGTRRLRFVAKFSTENVGVRMQWIRLLTDRSDAAGLDVDWWAVFEKLREHVREAGRAGQRGVNID